MLAACFNYYKLLSFAVDIFCVRSTPDFAAASPVVIVKRAPDGTIELWRGLPDASRSRLVSEIEPRDGVIYRDLRDALAGEE
jgi:hypothetical protein